MSEYEKRDPEEKETGMEGKTPSGAAEESDKAPPSLLERLLEMERLASQQTVEPAPEQPETTVPKEPEEPPRELSLLERLMQLQEVDAEEPPSVPTEQPEEPPEPQEQIPEETTPPKSLEEQKYDQLFANSQFRTEHFADLMRFSSLFNPNSLLTSEEREALKKELQTAFLTYVMKLKSKPPEEKPAPVQQKTLSGKLKPSAVDKESIKAKEEAIRDLSVGGDYYQALGLRGPATIDDVKKAYQKRQKIVHEAVIYGVSEAHKDLAKHKSQKINEAYGVLSDADKKKEYDLLKGYTLAETLEQQSRIYEQRVRNAETIQELIEIFDVLVRANVSFDMSGQGESIFPLFNRDVVHAVDISTKLTTIQMFLDGGSYDKAKQRAEKIPDVLGIRGKVVAEVLRRTPKKQK